MKPLSLLFFHISLPLKRRTYKLNTGLSSFLCITGGEKGRVLRKLCAPVITVPGLCSIFWDFLSSGSLSLGGGVSVSTASNHDLNSAWNQENGETAQYFRRLFFVRFLLAALYDMQDPGARIRPVPPAVEGQVLNHWAPLEPGKSPSCLCCHPVVTESSL